MKKDVLFLCQYFYPEYISSATLPTDVALALSKEGITVDVLTGFPYEYNTETSVLKKETHEGINIQRVKYLKLKRSNIVGRLVNFFSFFSAMACKLPKIRKYKVVIVYSNPPILPLLAVWAKRLFKVKIVFVSFDVYPEIAIKTNSLREGSLIDKIMNYINKKLFKSVDKVVALSSDMKGFLLKNRQISADKINVIPNWYDGKNLGNVHHKVSQISDFISEGDLVVSYFGNMGICQDMSTLMSAIIKLKDYPNIKFLMAGHGVKQDSIRQEINNNELNNIIMFDFLQGDDYKYALSSSDCFVVSLEHGVEGLAVPSKTYSYMMAGKTLISIMSDETDIAKEVLEKKLGIHVSNANSDELVERLILLSKDRDFVNQSGINARKLFLNRYTTEINTKKYVEMIEEML